MDILIGKSSRVTSDYIGTHPSLNAVPNRSAFNGSLDSGTCASDHSNEDEARSCVNLRGAGVCSVGQEFFQIRDCDHYVLQSLTSQQRLLQIGAR
ncbi:unnamed protein product [Haemonchus placei]|uniref:Uncharacterized protein n=1 Tax=Haemonchus placei TaxID=6290 RepID=A0A0N4VRV2_HAEPC|nr:unnamed protein product [Haemonchus placei]